MLPIVYMESVGAKAEMKTRLYCSVMWRKRSSKEHSSRIRRGNCQSIVITEITVKTLCLQWLWADMEADFRVFSLFGKAYPRPPPVYEQPPQA